MFRLKIIYVWLSIITCLSTNGELLRASNGKPKKSHESIVMSTNGVNELPKVISIQTRILEEDSSTIQDIYNKTSNVVGDVKDTLHTAPVSWTRSQWYIILIIVASALIAFGCIWRCIPCTPRII